MQPFIINQKKVNPRKSLVRRGKKKSKLYSGDF